MPSGRRRRPSMTGRVRDRGPPLASGVSLVTGEQEVEQVGVPAGLRGTSYGVRPSRAGSDRRAPRASRPVDDRMSRRRARPPGGGARTTDTADAPLVDRDPAEVEHLEHLGPATGLGGVGEAVVRRRPPPSAARGRGRRATRPSARRPGADVGLDAERAQPGRLARITTSSAWEASRSRTSSPGEPPSAATTCGTRAAGTVTQYSYSSEPNQPLRSWPSKTRSPQSVSTASTCSPSRDQRRRRAGTPSG